MRRLKMGVAGPFSGSRQAYGQMMRTAMQALGELPGLDLQLFDDRADPAIACDAAQAAVRAGCRVVAGHFNSDCALAATPIYRASDCVLLLPAATAVGLADGRHVFRLCADEARQATAIASLLRAESGGLASTVWTDGSPYALRLLRLLEADLGHTLPPAPRHDSPHRGAGLVVVYLGSHVAVMARMRAEGSDWRGAAVCCDDCAIDEFAQSARAGTRVCAPHLAYGQLLQQAIVAAHRVCVLGDLQWTNLFDERGESPVSDCRVLTH